MRQERETKWKSGGEERMVVGGKKEISSSPPWTTYNWILLLITFTWTYFLLGHKYYSCMQQVGKKGRLWVERKISSPLPWTTSNRILLVITFTWTFFLLGHKSYSFMLTLMLLFCMLILNACSGNRLILLLDMLLLLLHMLTLSACSHANS